MTRPLPWIKLWIEAIHDPKILELTLAERGAWWSLLALAGECSANGALAHGSHPLSLTQIQRSLHLTPKERPILRSMITKMVAVGSLILDGQSICVASWEKRQENTTYHQRLKNRYQSEATQRGSSILNGVQSPPTPPPDREGDKEGEGDGDIAVTGGYTREDEARGHWERTLAMLGGRQMKFLVERSRALGYDKDGFLVVEVPDEQRAGNLNRRHNSTVRRALIDATGNNLVDIRFVLPQGVPEGVKA